ncbi:MAG: tyrosine-type recombinase/integrase [Acidimicrobiales bacterium]
MAATASPSRWHRAGRGLLDLYIGPWGTGPVFLGAKGGRMDRRAANRMVKRLARRAGIAKSISPHSLRHSFITALDAGVPLRDVQEAASHADPRTGPGSATPLTSWPRSWPAPYGLRRERYPAAEQRIPPDTERVAWQQWCPAHEGGRAASTSRRLGIARTGGCPVQVRR